MSQFKNLFGLLIVPGLLLINAGCKPVGPDPKGVAETDHDHDHDHGHEHAETYAGALAELHELEDAVRTAFTDGNPEDAHDALHEVGHVLELVVELANSEGQTPERMQAIVGAVESLFASYGAIDKGMHGDKGAAWKDVAEDVEKAMAVLQEGVAVEGHEHEGDDHAEEHGDHDEQHEKHDSEPAAADAAGGSDAADAEESAE